MELAVLPYLAARASASKAKTDGSESVAGLKAESVAIGGAASIAAPSAGDALSVVMDHEKTIDLDREEGDEDGEFL